MESSNYLFQAFIYLAAAVVSVPIAKRLGMGSVLGYLLAGVIRLFLPQGSDQGRQRCTNHRSGPQFRSVEHFLGSGTTKPIRLA